MKRTRKPSRTADAIITADIHLTESVPVSRTDDYKAAQLKKLEFLRQLQEQHHDCPILDGGDVFAQWKSSPWLLLQAYHHLPMRMITVPGNHDLPEHSIKQYWKSSLALLEDIEKIHVLHEEQLFREVKVFQVFGYGHGEYDPSLELDWCGSGRKILILHEMVFPNGSPPWPGVAGYEASTLLENHPEVDLIIVGHNHNGFVEEHNGQLVVVPGSMMRISADKANYNPRCYLYYAEDNKVDPVYYPIDKDVHSFNHIAEPKAREERLSAYIERMNFQWEMGMSFRGNLEDFFKKNETPKPVKRVIWQAIEKT